MVNIEKPFGPTLGEFKIDNTLVDTINSYTDDIINDKEKIKKQDAGFKLAGQVKQEFDIDSNFFNKYTITAQSQVDLLLLYYTPVVGASGAVFGLLLAFGVLFANTRLYIYIGMLAFIIISYVFNLSSNFLLYIFFGFIVLGRMVPEISRLLWKTFPIKAKYFVIIYGILELYLGIANSPADNVAHFAHLGGMLFGFLLIKYWQKDNKSLY